VLWTLSTSLVRPNLAAGCAVQAEIEYMMKVERNIITPQANKPVMGIVQDTLCACRLFTMRGTFVDRGMVRFVSPRRFGPLRCRKFATPRCLSMLAVAVSLVMTQYKWSRVGLESMGGIAREANSAFSPLDEWWFPAESHAGLT
jgi:hypothetical protein